MNEGDNATPHNAVAHKPTGPVRLNRTRTINGVFSTYVVDCSCGWAGPICATETRAKNLWHEHHRAAR